MILDILPLSHAATERVGYPTQKPLSLLDRLIRSVSDDADTVLDPFCGCATARVAAATLHRQWIRHRPLRTGDHARASKAARPARDVWQDPPPPNIPRRTDLGELPNYRTHKHALFGKQEGHCGGCRMAFPFWNFEIEHIVPRVQGRLGLRRQPAATLRGMQPGQGDRNAGRADREAQGTGATGRMVRRDGAKHVDFFKLNKALEEGIGIESACRPNDRRNPARTPSARQFPVQRRGPTVGREGHVQSCRGAGEHHRAGRL